MYTVNWIFLHCVVSASHTLSSVHNLTVGVICYGFLFSYGIHYRSRAEKINTAIVLDYVGLNLAVELS